MMEQCLAQVTPIVVGMSKMTGVLKAGHALSHYQGGVERTVYEDKPYDPANPKVRPFFLRQQSCVLGLTQAAPWPQPASRARGRTYLGVPKTCSFQ